MKEADYNWCEEDGIVILRDNTKLSQTESLEFLLEQAGMPATTYVHKSYVATGLAAHARRLHAVYEEAANVVLTGSKRSSLIYDDIELLGRVMETTPDYVDKQPPMSEVQWKARGWRSFLALFLGVILAHIIFRAVMWWIEK